jgi:hypothetical protein
MKLRVVRIAITLSLLLGLLSSLDLLTAANARGFGGHSSHFASFFLSRQFQSYWWRSGFWRSGYWWRGRGPAYYGSGYAPTYGGFVDDSPVTGSVGYPISAPVQFVAARSAVTCQPSVETVTVPSEEDSGTRQIAVRRCMR